MERLFYTAIVLFSSAIFLQDFTHISGKFAATNAFANGGGTAFPHLATALTSDMNCLGTRNLPVNNLRRGAPWFQLPDLTSALLGLPCVGAGHTIGLPSQRAIRKNRFQIVGAP